MAENQKLPIPRSEDHKDDSSRQGGVVTQEKVKTKRPPMYRVYLINDDFTPMDFVVDILRRIFDKDHVAATEIMLAVHKQGKGLCGTYPYEVAETKVSMVLRAAKTDGHPLQCTVEPA